MEKTSTFAERLKELMQIRGATKTDIAKVINKSLSNVGRYLSGAYEGKADVIDMISKAYNVNPQWLMGYDVSLVPDEDGANLYFNPDFEFCSKTLQKLSPEEVAKVRKVLEALFPSLNGENDVPEK